MFGKKLENARERRKLDLKEVAALTGLPYWTLRRYEKDMSTPTLPNAIKLAKAYKESLDNLFLPKNVTK